LLPDHPRGPEHSGTIRFHSASESRKVDAHDDDITPCRAAGA